VRRKNERLLETQESFPAARPLRRRRRHTATSPSPLPSSLPAWYCTNGSTQSCLRGVVCATGCCLIDGCSMHSRRLVDFGVQLPAKSRSCLVQPSAFLPHANVPAKRGGDGGRDNCKSNIVAFTRAKYVLRTSSSSSSPCRRSRPRDLSFRYQMRINQSINQSIKSPQRPIMLPDP
jgi:hypothetical protein